MSEHVAAPERRQRKHDQIRRNSVNIFVCLSFCLYVGVREYVCVFV